MSEQAISYQVAPPQRARNTLVGTSFAVAGMFMYFACILGIYISERADSLGASQSWIPNGIDLKLTAPSVVLWTLILSVVTMQWAVYSCARNDRRHLLLALLLTALFGAAVINQFFFIFQQLGFEIDDGSKVAPLFYTILGSFILAVAIALVFLIITGIRSLSGHNIKSNVGLVSSAAIYWDSLVIIYLIIWLVIFVTK